MKLYGMHGAGQIICALIIEELGLECELFSSIRLFVTEQHSGPLALWPGAGSRA